jgi:tetratricopeptide (TPR) repeat protein
VKFPSDFKHLIQMMLRHLTLVMLLCLAACSSANERANAQAERAVALLELNDLTGSRMAALKAVSERDDSSEIWMLLARIEMARNDLIEAYRAFARALELDRSNPVALGAVAEIGYQVGALDDADEAADQLLLVLPESDSALLIKGLVALDRDQKDEAQKYAERLLAANPASATGLALRARVLSTSGNNAEAKQILQAAISAGKRDPTLLWTLVAILQNEGDRQGVDTALTHLRDSAPGQKEFAFKLAFLLYKSRQIARADDVMFDLLEFAEKAPETERRIEQMCLDFGPAVLTPTLVERVRTSQLQSAKLLLARHALTFERPQQVKGLLDALDRSKLKLWQANLAEGLKAQVALLNGQNGEAQERAENLLKKDARNSDALLVLGKIALQTGKVQEATASFQNVVSDNPMNRAGRIALAQLYTQTKQKVLARQTWEQAIQDLPDDPELAIAFAAYLRSVGEFDRQRRLIKDYVAQNPGSPRALYILENACADTSQPWCTSAISHATAVSNLYLMEDSEPTPAGNRGLFSSIKPRA